MYMLKFVAIVWAFSDSAFSRRMPLDVKRIWLSLTKPYDQECIQKTKPTQEDLDAIVDHGFVPWNQPTGCYLYCVYELTGIMKPNGEVHLELMMDIAPYMTLEISEMCTEEAESYPGPDMCEKAHILGNCIVKVISV